MKLSEFPGKIVIGLVRMYQLFLSPVLPPTCRYIPTCSTYTIEAVTKYGVVRGGWMGLCRILRCHPFARGGYDPLP